MGRKATRHVWCPLPADTSAHTSTAHCHTMAIIMLVHTPALAPIHQSHHVSPVLSQPKVIGTQYARDQSGLGSYMAVPPFILHFTTLCHAVLCYTILYYTILYCTVMYCTVLYYTVLYCTILYCTVLYYTILYYTVLYYVAKHRHEDADNKAKIKKATEKACIMHEHVCVVKYSTAGSNSRV
jgi:hypothetical protein